MSVVGIVLIAGWAVLLGVWAVRLPVERLYKPLGWVQGWIISRLLLRFGLGVFGILWWEALRHPPPSPFSVLVVQGSCNAAWEAALSVAQQLWAKEHRVGVIAAKKEEAFWVVPPTKDQALFRKLVGECLKAEKGPVVPASVRLAGVQLRPWQDQLIQVVWIGAFSEPPMPFGDSPQLIPQCGQTPSTASGGKGEPQQLPIKSVPWGEAEGYALLFFLCGGLLLGSEVALYILRKHLPLRETPQLLR